MSVLSRTALSVALFALLLVPHFASAECTNRVIVPYGSGTVRAFGYNGASGVPELARTGNSFFMECDAQLGSVVVYVKAPTGENGGIPPISQGDLLRCEILDENRNPIMSTTAPFPAVGGSYEIVFLFWDHEFRLATGTYQFLISTVEERWGLLYVGEPYDGGMLQEDYLGFWTSAPAFDLNFKVYWDANSEFVETESHSIGTIKTLYR